MRTLLRYLLITGAAVALVWCAVGLRIEGKSLFGHLRSFSDGEKVEDILARIKAEIGDAPPRPPKPKAKPKPAADVAQAKRVERLRAAQESARARKPARKAKPPPPGKTRVEERISPAAGKALDDLLDRRVAKLR